MPVPCGQGSTDSTAAKVHYVERNMTAQCKTKSYMADTRGPRQPVNPYFRLHAGEIQYIHVKIDSVGFAKMVEGATSKRSETPK